MKITIPFFSIALLLFPQVGSAEQDEWEAVTQISTHIGRMTATLSTEDDLPKGDLGFEPFQLADDMFKRDDVVFLMRHGPTDWSKLDIYDVAPDDCENQRIMTLDGQGQMARMGQILANNDIIPSQIVVSEWCRNQQTLDSLMRGFSVVDPKIAEDMPVEVDSEANLLLSLQGASSVERLRERISDWDGNENRSGPLMIISHYTNIEELTQFRVFEGEVLVIDPKRDNRVIGYFRMDSAGPDVGHFGDALESPLLEGNEAFNMIERYYQAVGTQDLETLRTLLTDGWVARGTSDGQEEQSLENFLDDVKDVTSGLTERNFTVEDIYITDDVVTVIGEITGRHTGDIYGISGTGNHVSFGAIAVHKLEGGRISESWQISDRVGLIQQISQ